MSHYEGTAASRYMKLSEDRFPFLDRARRCAEYTIPSLIPPEGANSTTEYLTPYQSLGAKGVNNLANKLLMTVLPPNATWFRLVLDDGELEKINPPLMPQEKELLDQTLSTLEQRVHKEVSVRAIRTNWTEAARHILVGGNVLVKIEKKGMRVFPLSQYVVDRDPEGNVLEIVIEEFISPEILPQDIQGEVKARLEEEDKDAEFTPLYTHIERRGTSFYVYQQTQGVTVPGSAGSWPIDRCPYLPLRWTHIDGESYGRGYCEEYLGDLASCEALAKSIVEFSLAASRVIPMVNPNGMTDPDDLESPNMTVVEGKADDVTFVQMEKYADFRTTRETYEDIKQELKQAFLLNSSVQRNAERVTAEEIRYMANELETQLGGLYSILAEEFQLPLVKILMAQMTKEGRLPQLPKDSVHPVIVAGLDALGRTQELMRLSESLTTASQLLGPEAVVARVNTGALIDKIFTANGVDPKGLILSDQEVAQQQQAMQQAAMLQKATPNAVKAVGDAYLQNQQAAQQQQQPSGANS